MSKIRPKRIPRDGERGADGAAEEEEEDDEVQVDFSADRECNICGKVFCNPQYMKVCCGKRWQGTTGFNNF